MTWPILRIGDLCGRASKCDPRKRPEELFAYIDISGIDRELKQISVTTQIAGSDAPSRARQVVHAGDILVSTVRPNLNAVATVPPELDGEIASTGFCVLRPHWEAVDRSFLFYFTRTRDFVEALLQHVRGANYPAVTDRNVLDVSIPLPALSEQRRIVEILDEADRLRRQRHETDAKVARILPALFHKTFGDPVKNTKQWLMRPLSDVADSRLGKMLDAKRQTGEYRKPYLRNANVQWDRFDLTELLEMDFLPEERAEFRLQRGDLLVCEGGEVGRCAIWRNELSECYFQKALHRVRPIEGKATSEYLLYLLWSLADRGGLRDSTSQLTIAHLTGVKLKRMAIPVPPFSLQLAFSKIVNSARDPCCAATNSKRLDRLFDVLLHRAFTGELTAGWRQKHKTTLEAELQDQLKAIEAAKSAQASKRRRKVKANG